MGEVLFKVPRDVSEEEVREKINYFVSKAEWASDVFENDKTEGKSLAKELRDELKEEYKNNDKVRTEDFYRLHNLFRNYKSVVQDSYVKTVGVLDKGQKTRSFLYDVKDYMKYHFD